MVRRQYKKTRNIHYNEEDQDFWQQQKHGYQYPDDPENYIEEETTEHDWYDRPSLAEEEEEERGRHANASGHHPRSSSKGDDGDFSWYDFAAERFHGKMKRQPSYTRLRQCGMSTKTSSTPKPEKPMPWLPLPETPPPFITPSMLNIAAYTKKKKKNKNENGNDFLENFDIIDNNFIEESESPLLPPSPAAATNFPIERRICITPMDRQIGKKTLLSLRPALTHWNMGCLGAALPTPAEPLAARSTSTPCWTTSPPQNETKPIYPKQDKKEEEEGAARDAGTSEQGLLQQQSPYRAANQVARNLALLGIDEVSKNQKEETKAKN